MKLSEITGEKALDVLADIIDPISIITSDKEIATALNNNNNLFAVKKALKNYKKEVIAILAALDGEDVETYKPNVLTLPIKLIEILNDEDMIKLFQSQGQTTTDTSSGSATENTEADVQ